MEQLFTALVKALVFTTAHLQQQQEIPMDLSSALALNSLISMNTNTNNKEKTTNLNRSRSNSSSGKPTKPQVAVNTQKSTNSIQQQQQQHQRRVRTQMTQYQVNVMRLIFAEYKTPTMNECEQMGREINLKNPKKIHKKSLFRCMESFFCEFFHDAYVPNSRNGKSFGLR